MAYWGGGVAGGWSQSTVNPGGMRLRRSIDGWEEEEALGRVYDHRVIRRLARYLAPYKPQAILAFVGMLVYAATSYVQPLLIGEAVRGPIRRGDLGGLNLLGGIFVVLVLASWGAQYVQVSSTGYIGHRILYTLRTQMFDHLQKLSVRFYDNNEVGRIMSRMTSDVTVLQDLLTTGVLTIFSDIIGLAFIVFFLLIQDVQLALLTLTVMPVLVVIMALWQRRARRAFIQVRQAIAVVNANLQENVSGVRVIQSLSREGENVRRFDTINTGNLEANIEAGRLQAVVMPVVELLSATALAIVIVVGGQRVLNHSLDPVVGVSFILSFALYIQRFFDPVRDLVLQYTQLQRAMAGGARVFEVLDTPPDIEDAADALDLEDIRGEVVFDHVDFSYVEDVEVLHDFSLHVRPGETVALVGPTGAGKTTVTALIARFYDVTEGSLLIDGHDIRQIRRQSLTRRMGMVLQDAFLFSGTVQDNIRYGRLEASDEEVEKAARVVGAHDFIARLEHGYDTVLHERGQNLSVGQRQLISFARAVLAEPRILILDEATANVDTRTEVVIQRALKKLLKGRTSFVIAHRLSTVRGADRVVVMDGGQIVEAGKHNELLAQDGLYARLYRMTYLESAKGGRDGDGLQPASPAGEPAENPSTDPSTAG
jgi:ABC-type multidrug transport system fused ATPase/permease subunit